VTENGDMNAKVGKKQVYRPVTGKHSLHKMSNDNRMRLINFASSRNVVVGSTMFEHKTYTKGHGNVFNQIDHILIDARHCLDLMDVRACRGANMDYDHYLVISKVRS
jgi:hypothetical protein